MHKEHLNACIVPSSDAHLGEYTPEHWKGRSYLSGFTGSAGTLAVTETASGLWTDSRYFLQGAQQLEGTEIVLQKEGEPGVLSIEAYLAQHLKAGDKIGCDGKCFSQSEIERLTRYFDSFGIELETDHDLLNEHVWPHRPEIPAGEFFLHPEIYSGETTAKRLTRIRQELAKHGANAIVMTMLDELAWAFNIRGKDVECNPVGVGYGFIGEHESVLFALEGKVSPLLDEALGREGVKVKPYDELWHYLAQLGENDRVLVDKGRMSNAVYRAISPAAKRIEAVSVVTLMKSIKNEAEVKGVKESMLRDGVALTRFFIWLEETLAKGETPSEVAVGEKLTALRAEHEMYVCDSFDTICGYQDHGAIVHYRAAHPTAHNLRNEGVLLIDSGAQYLDGTTDITRTIALGPATPAEQLRTDYTLVLKGHIAIATAQFPIGTRGNQLDILARKALWDRGLHYGHGTGHGVGVFLNVHEGPQNIRMDNNPTPMSLGTLTSNEPGLYRAGEYGIRIENLILTVDKATTPFGQFLGFETLTLCYLDNRLVKKELLTAEELAWYNSYQQQVYTTIAPLLRPEEAAWLKEKTAAI